MIRGQDEAKAEAEKYRQENNALIQLKDMTLEDVMTLIKSKEATNRLDEMFGALARFGRY